MGSPLLTSPTWSSRSSSLLSPPSPGLPSSFLDMDTVLALSTRYPPWPSRPSLTRPPPMSLWKLRLLLTQSFWRSRRLNTTLIPWYLVLTYHHTPAVYGYGLHGGIIAAPTVEVKEVELPKIELPTSYA